MSGLERALYQLNISITPDQLAQFERYQALLLEWNERVNLTRITDPDDIACKHFADSLLPLRHIPPGSRCIDVGSGAGFPGIPIAIMSSIELTLLDSQRKRTDFLRAAAEHVGVQASVVQSRAEDAAHTALRESFDIVLSRAVAPAPVLAEYLLPFCKVGGLCLVYKGKEGRGEIVGAQKAITTLGGKIGQIDEYALPWGSRTIACIAKRSPTRPLYPRKAGTPAKSPL